MIKQNNSQNVMLTLLHMTRFSVCMTPLKTTEKLLEQVSKFSYVAGYTHNSTKFFVY